MRARLPTGHRWHRCHRWHRALSLGVALSLAFIADLAAAATPFAHDGRPLRWPTPPGAERPEIRIIGYPGAGIPAAELSRIGRAAFARWQAATDGAFDVRWWPGAGPPPAPAFDGLSTVVFRSTAGFEALARPATARLRYDGSGHITEVDVLIDDVDFSVAGDDAVGFFGPLDLEAVLVHEFGHALGLDHSGVLESTMLPWPWEGQAELACDDVAGARAAFGLPVPAIVGRLIGPDGEGARGVQVLAVEVASGRIVGAMPGPDGRFEVALPRPGAWTIGVAPFAPGPETLAAPPGAPPCGGRVPRQWAPDRDGHGAAVVEVGPGATARIGDVAVRCEVEAIDGAAAPGAAFDPRSGEPVRFVGSTPNPEPTADPEPGPDPEPPPDPESPPDPEPPGPGEPCATEGAPCADGVWCDTDDPAGPTCRLEVCGDGHTGLGEQCDDGDDTPGDGCERCRIVGRLGEACDAERPCGADGRCVDARCAPHVCGDGLAGGDEPCDGEPDCTADCRLDPMYDDADAPDGPEAPGALPFDAAGDARVGYALGVGEADWFALDLAARGRIAVEVEDPRGARCGEVMVRLVRADDPGDALALDEAAYGLCARLDATLEPGRYLLRLGARGNRGHGPRWLHVRRRALPAVGEACGDPLAPCPDDAWCTPERICAAHVCGDGVRGPGEACDDGDPDPSDGCDARCRRTPLPAGAACDGDEACGSASYCGRGRCRPHTCGDGVLGPGEACDFGPDPLPGAVCDADCRFTVRDRFAAPVRLDAEDGARHFALNGVAGALVVHALDWGLHGDRSVRLTLLDAAGRPVPGARGVAPRAVGADGMTDFDASLVVAALPFGDYVLRAEAHRLPGHLSPRAGRLRDAGAPVLLLGSISPEPPADAAPECAPAALEVPPEADGPPPRPPTPDDGCAALPGAPASPGAALLLLLLGAATLRRRRGPMTPSGGFDRRPA